MRAAAGLVLAFLTLGAVPVETTSAQLAAPRPREEATALQTNAPAQPTLLVMVTLDQLRPDYLDRFGAQFTGGLRRLLRGGALYTQAFYDHAITETAPGHATILSGRHPRSTGIVRNTPGVQDANAPLVDADGAGASPVRFRGSTLVDWLHAKDPRSRTLSISAKDRGAILPVGRSRQDVYWYAPQSGRFTTSAYYRDTLPSWVRAFNARGEPRRSAGRVWELLLPAAAYPEPDSVAAEGSGQGIVFPHHLSSDSTRAALALPATPFMDEITLAFALDGLRAMQLGAGPHTDVIAVSLSATDYIGHRFGPDSREIHDQILRLDRSLGVFLDSLYAMRDSARVVVALTADHGVAPHPELHFANEPRVIWRADLWPLVSRYRALLAERGADSTTFDVENGMLFIDRVALARAGVNADSLARAFVVDARRVPGIGRADLFRDLARRDTTRDEIARRWLHSIPPGLPVAAVVTLRPYGSWAGDTYATHGTPHDYDAHVPLLLFGGPFRAGRYTERVRVVDLAPTLARALGVVPSERLDGRVLMRALTESAATVPRTDGKQ